MRIALVGYGKVGQALYRAARRFPNLEFVAIADPRFGRGLQPPAGVHCFAENRIKHMPWKWFTSDLVIDASGAAQNREQAAEHLESGAPRVVVTQSMPDADATLIAEVNARLGFDPLKHLIISASSCTAVCFAPLVYYLDLEFGIREAEITILHGYDPENIETDIDLARAEAGAVEKLKRGKRAAYRTNFVRNVEAVLPALAGKLTAEAFYLNDGSYSAERALFFKGEFRFKKTISIKEINGYVSWLRGANLAGTLASVFTPCRPAKVIAALSLPTLFFPWLTLIEGETTTLFFGGNYIDGYAMKVLALASLLAERLG